MEESGYKMKIGLIGIGKMGSAIVLKLLGEGHEVIVWNRSSDPIQELKLKIEKSRLQLPSQSDGGQAKFEVTTQNLKVSKSIQDLMLQLGKFRIVWLMLPAGEATQNVLDEVSKYTKQGDIIIDGGNSNFKDTERAYKEFRTKNIKFLGIGVSGGVHGFNNGFSLMAGGDLSAYEYIKPVLETLSNPKGGYNYFGEGGAGHFVKMVHNGIEYGMMQSIGEGFGVLNNSPYKLDLLKVSKLWQHGTIISGFLIDRVTDALDKDASLSSIEGSIDASGEGEWTVNQGKEEGVPVDNIEQSLEFRKRSKTDPAVANSFAAKLIASLRHEFGGHKVDKTSKE